MLAVMHLIACNGERPFVVPPDLNPLVGEKILPLQRGLGALRLGVLVLGSFLFVHCSPFSGHLRIVSKAPADEMRMNSRGVRLLRTFCELEANFLELRKGEVRRIHLPRTSVNEELLVCSLERRGSIGAQPHRDVLRLHRLPYHVYQLLFQCLQVPLVSEFGRKAFEGLPGVVPPAIRASVYESLDTPWRGRLGI